MYNAIIPPKNRKLVFPPLICNFIFYKIIQSYKNTAVPLYRKCYPVQLALYFILPVLNNPKIKILRNIQQNTKTHK